jgi:acetyltransferase-like isoleucine patch superfamily enzyme
LCGEKDLTSTWLRELFGHYHKAKVGMYSYGCFYPRIPDGTTIGKFSSFADHIDIFLGDHKIGAVTNHPFIYNPEAGVVDRLLRTDKPITIGNDVWIGNRVTILPKVGRIGDGAVIGAGSVVTREVPPYAVVVGIPGKVIKYRFPPDVVKKLLEIRWWDWPPERIFKNHPLFNDVDAFLKAHEKGEIK